MGITAKYILICDDFRREDNGKLIIIGLYPGGDMRVVQIPFVMPTLTFFMSLESDRPGTYAFRLKIQHQETGTILGQGMGLIPVNDPRHPIIMPVKIGGVVFNVQGLYSLSIEIDGNKDPIVQTFEVQLGAPLPMLPPTQQLGR